VNVELAKRAVACKGWRWMPGMRTHHTGRRVHAVTVTSGGVELLDGFSWRYAADAVPDLDDPATLGCLLALVREAWGDPTIVAVTFGGYSAGHIATPIVWGTISHEATDVDDLETRATEAEALVAALEAAP
jgi:hypothetical protein